MKLNKIICLYIVFARFFGLDRAQNTIGFELCPSN